MKRFYLLFMTFIMAFAINGWGQTTIDSQGFETDLSGYSHTPSQIPADDPGDQYFYRAIPSDPAIYEGSVGPYTNVTGDWLFVGSNPNTINGGNPGLLILDPIVVTGYSNLEFHADFGACPNDWDTGDDLSVEYNFDGGSWSTLFYFEVYGDGTNEPLELAGNSTGGINTANGTVLTYALTTISSDNFSGSGTTLNIRIVCDANANYEAFGLDNIQINGLVAGGVNNPTGLMAATASTSQIDLSWTQNANSDNVMVAYTLDGTFGTPTDGSAYSVGNTISGGGEVIYNGSATIYNHSSLTADTRYYYKAWSVDATPNYSSGVTDDTTTLAAEPTADPTSFTATTNSASEITLNWTDASPAATNYLLKGSSVSYGDIVNPADGTTEANTSLVQNVAAGVQTSQFIGLAPGTTYYFQIYPYNGDNGSVNYKINSPQQASETTDAANTNLIISEVADPDDVYQARFAELYNLSASTIDFDLEDWYLCRQTNGGTTWEDKKLTGSVSSGNTYVVANNNDDVSDDFNTNYGFMADYNYGGSGGNGDDGYYLYYGGTHLTGTLIDAYGVIDEDGTGTAWEYEDTKAVRLRSVTSPNNTWEASEWDIPGSSDVDDMTPSAHKEDVNWLGLTADDWNTKGSNWSSTNGYIPDASFNVTIPATANNPAIGTQSACNNLTLGSDAALSVGVGQPITAYGNLTIAAAKDRAAASFVVDSDASGNGSVIVKGTVTGSTVVKRYFEAYTGAGDGWHYIGSPVNAMTIASSDFDPTGTSNDLYAWDEDDYLWRNYKGSNFPGTTFLNGLGYMVAYQAEETNEFVGTLNSIDVTFNNLSKTPAKGDGWHLLGNPFASAIEWNDGNWALSNVGGVAKVYDEAGGSYSDINANDIIPSTNGFFIQAETETNSITIPAASRVHDDANNYKNSRSGEMDETLKLLVNNDANGFYDRTSIGFRDDAETTFDWAFDSHKMFGQATAPQIWTLIEGEEFSTNNLPHVYETMALPMNFKAGVNSTFHIIAEGIESFYLNSEIYLEDLFNGNMIDLREQTMYTFDGSTSDDNARFVLHFFGVTDLSEIPVDEDIKVYGFEDKILVKTTETNVNCQMEVFDLMGRKVFSNDFMLSGLVSFSPNVKNGVYLVRLQSGSSVIVNKVNLR